jgi:hypothetical protein
MSTNYSVLVHKVVDDLSRWRDLPLTLFGRIRSIKTNVLPKMMYLDQSLPISLPKSYFKSLNKTRRQFVWNHKTPRASLDKWTWDYSLWGLCIPNFKMYYWTAQIRLISFLFETEPAPSWTQMEMFDLKRLGVTLSTSGTPRLYQQKQSLYHQFSKILVWNL